jgi:anti-sigma factor RsiW
MRTMDCPEARALLVDLRRGRLLLPQRESLRAHLCGCGTCSRLEAAEAALDDLLDGGLPRRAASAGLRIELERMVAATPGTDVRRSPTARAGWRRLAAPALAACLAVTLAGAVIERLGFRDEVARTAFVSDAVSEHLRALSDARGPELVSGVNHEVKPWFEGRLDFAPVVPMPDVAELRLRGGSVGYFLDRKGAVVSYSLRRHAVTLLAFRPDGLGLPGTREPDGKPGLRKTTARGFRVVAWRSSEVGYALVSDVAAAELDALAAAFAAATSR